MITVFYNNQSGLPIISQGLCKKCTFKANLKHRFIKSLSYYYILSSTTRRLITLGLCDNKANSAINKIILMLLDYILA